jgi:hypothetical protein
VGKSNAGITKQNPSTEEHCRRFFPYIISGIFPGSLSYISYILVEITMKWKELDRR